MEKTLNEKIVIGKVADYAIQCSEIHEISKQKLAEILKEISEQLISK